jgi:hypothetical protein
MTMLLELCIMHIFIVLKYGILFWDISKNYKRVFILQKKAMRISANVSRTTY